MKYFTNKFENLIREYIDSAYKRINVFPGKLHFNYKCHLNAVHYAIKKKDKKIALVTYRERQTKQPYVHFVNYHKGKFIDNTVGYWAFSYEYRFIRWVGVNEFDNAVDVLLDTQEFFKNKATFLQKLFADRRM